MAIYTFERYEKKFLLPVDKAERIEKRLAGERGALYDKYSAAGQTYGIYNIYFDDENSSVFCRPAKRPSFWSLSAK